MTPERVDYMLAHFRECEARCEYLKPAIWKFEKEIAALKASAIDDTISIGGQGMDSMPRASDIRSTVEDWAIRFADGYTPEHILEAQTELTRLKEEYENKHLVVLFVTAWLKALSNRERFIIENKVIGNMYWRDLSSRFAAEFGETYTRVALKGIEKQAREKIYRIAE